MISVYISVKTPYQPEKVGNLECSRYKFLPRLCRKIIFGIYFDHGDRFFLILEATILMAITKDKKKALLKEYVADLKNSGSTYVINQNAIPVEVATQIRKEIKTSDAKINVVRKRIFLKAVEEAGFEGVDLSSLEGAVVAIFAKSEDFSPLKVISKYNKEFKVKSPASSFGFLGGWDDTKWKDAAYVTELANVPSKDELISKFLWLLQYPVQSFACVLNEAAKKSA